MKQTIDKSEGYRDFLKSIDLIGIALVRAEVLVDRETYFGKKDTRLIVEWDCKPSDIESNYFELSADFSARVLPAEGDKPLLSIKAGYLLHFHTQPVASRSLISRYAESEVRFVLWPYFREYVTNTCGRMHIPPIFLPLSGKQYGGSSRATSKHKHASRT